MKNKLLALALFCGIQYIAAAQNPVFRTINTSTGLPSNTTYNILQDSIGFIWIAHDKGLSRYDGKQFVHFTAKSQQSKSLSNLLEIRQKIWCQDFSGNFYHTENGMLIQDNRIKSKGTYTPGSVINKQILTVINPDSIRSLDIASGRTSAVKNTAMMQYAMWPNGNKTNFLSDNQILSFDGTKITTEKEFSPAVKNIFFVVQCNDDYFLISKSSYPSVYKVSENTVKDLPVLKPGLFIQGVNKNKSEIWLCTTVGAYCFDYNFKPKYNGRCFFEGTSISNVLQDKEGNYWFCTLSDGIFLVTDINVNSFSPGKGSITSLSDFDNADEILIGTSNNALLRFNIRTFQQNLVYKENTNHEVFDILYDSLSKNIIYCSDKIVIVNKGKKIKSIHVAAKAFTDINKDLAGVAYGSGVSIISKTNQIQTIPEWLRLPNRNWEENHYRIVNSSARGRDILYNPVNQTLYAATADGILFFNTKEKGQVLYQNKPIYACRITQCENYIIAATYTEGLLKIENTTATNLIALNSKQANSIYRIKYDGKWLWMAGEEFISRYNIQTHELVTYNDADGLPKAEIKDILIKNGQIYIATSDGLVSFETNKTSINKLAPHLTLNEITVNNKIVLLNQTNNFRHNENNVRIQYSAVAFRGAESVKVQYRINNGNWQTTDQKSNQIVLPSLSPDDYKIDFRAFNEDGVMDNQNISISFSIDAPFYKKFWFALLLISILLGIMYLYFKWRLSNERKNNKLKEDKNKLEQELQKSLLSSIKSQMNPHFIFNALNTIQSYIYTNDKENASQYLGKFSELTRMILEMSNKETVSLSEEIKSLKLYIELEQIRFEDKLKYNFIIDNSLNLDATFIPSMLIQPYIENAIKHGLLHKTTDWLLEVSFSSDEGYIVVKIEDNGIGRKRSGELNTTKARRQHQSFAVNANQKRLEILNSGLENSIGLKITDKEDAYGNATGTIVLLHIPFAQRK